MSRAREKSIVSHVIVIGAGFGGLVAAAELARAGIPVTILEAHILPGGCASTFFHQGFRFDCGATLAGGFATGAPMDIIGERFGISWGVRDISQAMVVHLPDGKSITRWTNHERWIAERTESFGVNSMRFWDWQERTADLLWDLAIRCPAWPPQKPSDMINLLRNGFNWANDNYSLAQLNSFTKLFLDAFTPICHQLKETSLTLRQFIDGQLLIASQTTSIHANSLYGAVALDLPRRGVVEVPGGMITLAQKIVDVVKHFGGNIFYHQEVTKIIRRTDSTFIAITRSNSEFQGDILILNLPPWNVKSLIKNLRIKKLESLSELPQGSWGAFTLYIGIDNSAVPQSFANHHQVIVAEPLGEGNSIFLSLSPEDDPGRAPAGFRALTISTHTSLFDWWRLFTHNRDLYEKRKQQYTEKILEHAELILPGLRSKARLILPGTPITFQRYTRREFGWVGGFPQTGLFNVWGPRLDRNIWMVGDTIFPGQSVPAVSLGAIRVASEIISRIRRQNNIGR